MADAAAVGERLHVEKVGKGGFASVEFKPEERDGKTLFRGAFATSSSSSSSSSSSTTSASTTIPTLMDAFSGVIHSIKEGGRFGFILARCFACAPASTILSSHFRFTSTCHHIYALFNSHVINSLLPPSCCLLPSLFLPASHSFCSIDDRRGSVYVNLEKKPEVKQGQASRRPFLPLISIHTWSYLLALLSSDCGVQREDSG